MIEASAGRTIYGVKHPCARQETQEEDEWPKGSELQLAQRSSRGHQVTQSSELFEVWQRLLVLTGSPPMKVISETWMMRRRMKVGVRAQSNGNWQICTVYG